MASMRDQMPRTAEWVDRLRRQFGQEYVNDAIRRAVAGEPDLFYALEGGHVLGTPFVASCPLLRWQDLAATWGCKFAGFFRRPDGEGEGAVNGAD